MSRSTSTFVTVLRYAAVRSSAIRSLSLAAQRVLIQVWAVACDEGEATWTDDGGPMDVHVGATMVTAEALVGELGRHSSTTDAEVQAALDEIRKHDDLWRTLPDGLLCMPRLAEKMPKRFRDRKRRQAARSASKSKTASATPGDRAGGQYRTGQERVLTDSPVLPTVRAGEKPGATPATDAPARKGPASVPREGPWEAAGALGFVRGKGMPADPEPARTRPAPPPDDHWGPCPACHRASGQRLAAEIGREVCQAHETPLQITSTVECPCGHTRPWTTDKPCLRCLMENGA